MVDIRRKIEAAKAKLNYMDKSKRKFSMAACTIMYELVLTR